MKTFRPVRYLSSHAAGALTLALLFSVPVQAQFQKPEDAIKYRKASFTVMSAHFGRIGAMVNGKAPYDAKVAAESAEVVAQLSRLPWQGFGEGTSRGDTKAKLRIWREFDKFQEGANKLPEEAGKLAVAAKSGNLEQLKTAFGATAQVCKTCHEAYKDD